MIMNLKGFGREQSWPNFKVLSWGTEGKPQKTSVGIGGRRGQELNLGPSEYEIEVLTIQPWHSVVI
jgi:hypothetical protein